MTFLKKIWHALGNEKFSLRLMYLFAIAFTSYSICLDYFPNWAKVGIYLCTVLMVFVTEFEDFNDDIIDVSDDNDVC